MSELKREVRIRNIEAWIVRSLRARACSKGNSLEEELRELLREEALRRRRELAAKLREMRGKLRKKRGRFSDSAALVREERNTRG